MKNKQLAVADVAVSEIECRRFFVFAQEAGFFSGYLSTRSFKRLVVVPDYLIASPLLYTPVLLFFFFFFMNMNK